VVFLETLPTEFSIVVAGDFWKSNKLIWKTGKEPDLAGPAPVVFYSKDFNWQKLVEQYSEVKKTVSVPRRWPSAF
jgi:hypothetical protein